MRRCATSLAFCALFFTQVAGAAPEPVLRIIFPEGTSVRQMADQAAHVRRIAIERRHVTPVLSGKGYAAAAARAQPPPTFARFLTRRSIEGFLFPAGYEFLPSSTPASLIARQVETFEQRWRMLDLGAAKAAGRTPYEVLKIASLVERETAVAAERRLVAAVIANRLVRGMPLAIDASLRYGLGIQGTRPLSAAHLRSSTPYNTHRFRGLPPTPITNPGLPSLRAAADPAAVDYLYYVRKPGSLSHFFTASEAEFCAKAVEYGYKGC
jgi:peptidoglycan lytic transglycosylase G